ncbi:MAG: hypothetical protein ACI9XP_001787, partial [Lentimonas sp.]
NFEVIKTDNLLFFKQLKQIKRVNAIYLQRSH